MRTPLKPCLIGLALAAASPLATADGLDTLGSSITGGKPNFDARLRYEQVEQDNALLDADALTLRTRLGYTTGKWNGFDVGLEYEGTVVIGDDQYNSTVNGRTIYSVIADPSGSELNQAFIRYAGIPGTTVKYGRQRIIFDNARFIGNVGWRQNEQTFDATLLTNTSIPKTTINYGFLTNANTITFLDVELHGHIVNVAVAPAGWLKLSAYAYLLDFDTNLAARADTQTIGLRAGGAIPAGPVKIEYTLEYADQTDYEDSTSVVDAEYMLAELGLATKPVKFMVGYEVLGSNDGMFAFQTPLATLHAFQGWADQFLVTPATGVKDLYASVGASLLGTKLLAVYHQFEADEGSADYGDEIDLLVSRPIAKGLSGAIKYADYNADGFSVDTQKLWVMTEYKF